MFQDFPGISDLLSEVFQVSAPHKAMLKVQHCTSCLHKVQFPAEISHLIVEY
jgi:hypothetical protein